jgi:hypothetical protein
MELPGEAEMKTGRDGRVKVKLSNVTDVTVEILTNLVIQSALDARGKVKVKTLIKLGQIAAQVNQAAGAEVTVGTPQGSVRATGTEFTVRYDEHPEPTTTVRVTEGRVEFVPLAPGAPPVAVEAGRQVVATPAGVGPVGPLAPTTPAGGAAEPVEPPLTVAEPAGPLGAGGKLETDLLTAVLTDQLGPDRRPQGPKDTFGGQAEVVHLYVLPKQEPPEDLLTVTWVRNGAIVEKQLAQMGPHEALLTGIYNAKEPALPPGDWWVTLKVGRQVLGSIRFRIGP